MSKEAEATAIEQFNIYKGGDVAKRFAEILKARIERHRDRLEKEADSLEAAKLRGQLRELREIFLLLSE